MDLNLLVISVNDGRLSGSGDQHSSISFLHPESHRSGTGGLRVFFTIPPKTTYNQIIKVRKMLIFSKEFGFYVEFFCADLMLYL